jgi:hypothetical protein
MCIFKLTFQVNMLQQEIRLKNQRIAQGFGGSTDDSSTVDKISTKVKRPALMEKTNSLL